MRTKTEMAAPRTVHQEWLEVARLANNLQLDMSNIATFLGSRHSREPFGVRIISAMLWCAELNRALAALQIAAMREDES